MIVGNKSHFELLETRTAYAGTAEPLNSMNRALKKIFIIYICLMISQFLRQ